MIKIGDLVRRKSHNFDVLFRVTNIDNNIAILKGEVIRLVSDAELSDLVISEPTDDETFCPNLSIETRNQATSGLILHIDGDEYYLKKAMQSYKQYNVRAIGYYIPENKIPFYTIELLTKHKPDIVVFTGHDAKLINSDLNDMSSYRSSKYFVEAVNLARNYNKDLDSLVIIAGACQSNYEILMESGANFASSPNRENIHLLDPVIIATIIAKSSISQYLNAKTVLDQTISKQLGGLETKGKARTKYNGGKHDY